ncbi:hypothetical protein NC652_028488 [Populus alba x Populus x berolinensis]|nr:hypothetical protein NC652_028488 [Populus alba x Populus x berolinensis]
MRESRVLPAFSPYSSGGLKLRMMKRMANSCVAETSTNRGVVGMELAVPFVKTKLGCLLKLADNLD